MEKPSCVILALCAIFACLIVTSEAGIADGCRYYRKMCKYRDQTYGRWESWTTRNCWECTCVGKGFGYKCCQDYWIPMVYDEECEAVWNKKECSYNVVRRDNPEESCDVFAGILK